MTGGVVRIGIAGWTHAPWRGIIYPTGLKQEKELEYAASHLRTIEIGDTFYGTQRPEAFESWASQVPAAFVFAVRGPRAITHILRLRNPQVALATFIVSGLLRLGIHLGPILWQLPANLRFDARRIEAFLKLLPTDTGAAATLGRTRDRSLRASAWLDVDLHRPMRHAVEVCHESFRCLAFIDLLRAYNVALVCADTAKRPRLMDVTADFVYCRLQGSAEMSPAGYDNAALDHWRRRIKAWASGDEPEDAERIGGKPRLRRRDVFVYFDNDKKVRAPANAMELIRRLRS